MLHKPGDCSLPLEHIDNHLEGKNHAEEANEYNPNDVLLELGDTCLDKEQDACKFGTDTGSHEDCFVIVV